MGIPEVGPYLWSHPKEGASWARWGILFLVFLEKEVEMRGAYVPGKKTFSFRSISMMAKQFEVMEGMGERSL